MASLLASLKEEFKAKFLDQNGLGLLQDESDEALKNARSDNPILFGAIGWTFFKDELDESDKELMRKSSKVLEGVEDGLFDRRPNEHSRSEAHDNYDGHTAIDIMAGTGACEKICIRGSRFGWSFPNQAPKTFSWKQLRQLGSVAYYKIGAGWVPYPLEMLWLCLGIIFAMLFGWASTHNLAYLKLETIPMALKKQENDALWGWVKAWWRDAEAICNLIAKLKSIFPRSFENYFGNRHAITKAAMLKFKK